MKQLEQIERAIASLRDNPVKTPRGGLESAASTSKNNTIRLTPKIDFSSLKPPRSGSNSTFSTPRGRLHRRTLSESHYQVRLLFSGKGFTITPLQDQLTAARSALGMLPPLLLSAQNTPRNIFFFNTEQDQMPHTSKQALFACNVNLLLRI